MKGTVCYAWLSELVAPHIRVGVDYCASGNAITFPVFFDRTEID